MLCFLSPYAAITDSDTVHAPHGGNTVMFCRGRRELWCHVVFIAAQHVALTHCYTLCTSWLQSHHISPAVTYSFCDVLSTSGSDVGFANSHTLGHVGVLKLCFFASEHAGMIDRYTQAHFVHHSTLSCIMTCRDHQHLSNGAHFAHVMVPILFLRLDKPGSPTVIRFVYVMVEFLCSHKIRL